MRKHDLLTDADRQRIALAVHEAGHAVAAVVLGGRVHKAVVDDTPSTEFDSMAPGTEASITYAGPWCQAQAVVRRHPQAALRPLPGPLHDHDRRHR